MTKSEFLELLEKNLKALSVEERNKTITYYNEMISDMIDSGLTQEEAVAKLGNPTDIAKEIVDNAREHNKQKQTNGEPTFNEVKKETPVQQELRTTKKVKAWPFILIGVFVLVAFVAVQVIGSVYFSRLPREKQVREFNLSDVKNISIDVEVDGFTVVETNDDKVIFECYVNKRYEYDVELAENTLEIDNDYNYSFFSDYNIEEYNSTLYLPKSYNGNFEFDGSVGAIYLETTHKFKNVDVEVSTGFASIKNITCNNLDVYQSTGSIQISNVVSNKINVHSSTGNFEIENSKMDELIVDQGTGLTKVKNVTGLTAEIKTVRIDASTGEVKFDNMNALNISIKVSTGDVEGRFNDSMSNYTITSHVSTGESNLPESFGSGPKRLDVKASTGDIEIEFAK